MAPRVLVSDELSETAVQIFRDRGVEVDFQPKLGKDKDKLAEIIGNYDGLAIRSATKATEKLIEAATNLKVIGRAGIGVDNVDIPDASRRGIIVMNTPFGNSITTAEHAIALMFAVARQLPAADSSPQAGKCEKSKFMGVEITGKTLGVIGAGNIGGIVCKKAIGLGMHVLAYDPFLSAERAQEMGVTKVELDELLAKADFITLHVPMTDKTRGILNAEAIAKTKPSYLVRSEQIASRLVSGEDSMAISGSTGRAYQFNQRGAALKFAFPSEGVVLLPQETFTLKGSPHPNAARLWIDFILSEEGQQIVKQVGYFSLR